MDNQLLQQNEIENRIFTIRGVQVMLDRDLAILYQTDTRTLKQAVKRNIDRFPRDFMFELLEDEIQLLVSQSVIPSKSHLGGSSPFVFSEQGVSMLSAVIRTPIAVEVSIKIIRAFVEFRKLITRNNLLFKRLDHLEMKQLDTDQKIQQIFNALENRSTKPEQGIFFDGQLFDAYTFASDLIRSAKTDIVLIDNYVDDTVLTLLLKRSKGVSATIYTHQITKQLKLDLEKHNRQYPAVKVVQLPSSHDRFLLIDRKELYHIGASLKDLGKKWFAFSKMDAFVHQILSEIDNVSSADKNG